MCYIFRRAGRRPSGLSPFGLLGMECPGLSQDAGATHPFTLTVWCGVFDIGWGATRAPAFPIRSSVGALLVASVGVVISFDASLAARALMGEAEKGRIARPAGRNASPPSR